MGLLGPPALACLGEALGLVGLGLSPGLRFQSQHRPEDSLPALLGGLKVLGQVVAPNAA